MTDNKALNNLDNILEHLEVWKGLIDLIQRFDGEIKVFNMRKVCQMDWEHLDWRLHLSYEHPNEGNFIYLKNDLYSTANKWGFKLI